MKPITYVGFLVVIPLVKLVAQPWKVQVRIQLLSQDPNLSTMWQRGRRNSMS